MHRSDEIRRRSDGSIDTGYYMQIGRTRRSQAFHNACSAIRSSLSATKSTSDQTLRVRERRSAASFYDWSNFIRQS